jgi:16S rRNA (adenine1518-N6/adenine1519-N6)-dimethyltransferase
VDGNLQRKIVDAVDPQPEDEILEIGPGRGALTRHLAGRCRRLCLVELDEELAAELSLMHEQTASVEVIHRSILDLPLKEISSDVPSLKVVGNIPYNITTPILFHLLRRPRPRVIVLMVQKEVADRIMAPPGGSTYGALSVGVQTVARVGRVVKVPASAFRPRPAVHSAVVEITPLRPDPLSEREEHSLRVLTRAAFQWRRKQIRTILRNHPDLRVGAEALEALERETGFSLERRPETFSPDEMILLSTVLRRVS